METEHSLLQQDTGQQIQVIIYALHDEECECCARHDLVTGPVEHTNRSKPVVQLRKLDLGI